MIEVKNLCKFYGPRQAVNNLNFNVEKGEVVGFLGPNGAGKSTTMNILACIMPASSGKVTVCGHDTFENALEIKRLLGYLPETPPLYPDMIVTDYLEFAAKIRKMPTHKIMPACKLAMEKCGLVDVRRRIVGKLSKGFQQRVGLAQALIHDPQILILDEPTVGLDPIQIIEIRKLIRELAAAHTIILSSHILPEITQVCRRVIIINDGEIAAVDSLEGLTSSMRKSERLLLKTRHAGGDAAAKLQELASVMAVHTELPNQFVIEYPLDTHLQDEIARLALDNGWGIVELKPLAFTLEDIFLKLTMEEQEVAA